MEATLKSTPVPRWFLITSGIAVVFWLVAYLWFQFLYHVSDDPGVGFAKTGEHNWQLLHRFEELGVLGRPLLVGVSRKAFLGSLLADGQGHPQPPKGRDVASTALTVVLAQHRVWGIRVHSVRASRDAIAVVQRFAQG